MSKSAFASSFTRRELLAVLALARAGAAQKPPKLRALETVSKTLPRFSEQSRERLAGLLNDLRFQGRLPAGAAQQIAAQEGRSIEQLMLDLLPLAQSFSRPPVSNYRVGAIVQGTSGDLYLGANLEVPAALVFSVHAEQSAACNAYLGGDSGIASLAVTAAPCGHCRQFLYELSNGHDIRIFLASGIRSGLSALLPYPFGPRDLGITEPPFSRKPLSISLATSREDDLAMAALDMARKSYAPYSKSPSGVAVRSLSGRVYSGAYLENAAFNPSLSPLEAAMVGMSMGNEDLADIGAVALVEIDRASISQESATRAVMEALAPKSHLHILKGRLIPA